MECLLPAPIWTLTLGNPAVVVQLVVQEIDRAVGTRCPEDRRCGLGDGVEGKIGFSPSSQAVFPSPSKRAEHKGYPAEKSNGRGADGEHREQADQTEVVIFRE